MLLCKCISVSLFCKQEHYRTDHQIMEITVSEVRQQGRYERCGRPWQINNLASRAGK